MDRYASPEYLAEIKGIEPYAVARTRCFPGMDYHRLVLISNLRRRQDSNLQPEKRATVFKTV
jgi:hypothetical protein